MSKLVVGLKTTLLSVLASVILFSLTYYFRSLWQPWSEIIEHVIIGLLILTFIFSAQFSRSRFSFLSALWLFFYLTLEQKLAWPLWLKLQPDASIEQWKTLYGVFLFFFFSFIKDRGLVSVHTFYRIIAIMLCGIGAYLWLYSSSQLLAFMPKEMANNNYIILFNKYLAVELPLFIVGVTLLVRSFIKNNLLDSALFVSFSVWCLSAYHWLPLSWSLIITVLVIHYLMVVVIDSYFLAYRDELTALPSRRALFQLALSLGRKYTVAMLDIDHFKKFNDTYGHDIGDQVLKLVAAKLAEIQGGGKVFRYGGEEFTVVFSRKDATQAQIELERLRQAIADYKMVIRQPQRKNKESRSGNKADGSKTVSITISIGVAPRTSKQSFEQVLKCSDLALYRAKKNGRNNVSL